MYNDDELQSDNIADYFPAGKHKKNNDMFVLNILDKDGLIDDVIIGLDKIRMYIKKIK